MYAPFLQDLFFLNLAIHCLKMYIFFFYSRELELFGKQILTAWYDLRNSAIYQILTKTRDSRHKVHQCVPLKSLYNLKENFRRPARLFIFCYIHVNNLVLSLFRPSHLIMLFSKNSLILRKLFFGRLIWWTCSIK